MMSGRTTPWDKTLAELLHTWHPRVIMGVSPPAIVSTPHLVMVLRSAFNLTAIPPSSEYVGPTSYVDNPCLCNTVEYSLYSACAACQGAQWVTWSQWEHNCSAVSSGIYTPAIPDGTRVPKWAYLVVDISDHWDPTTAEFVGDYPETTAVAFSMPATSTPVSATRASSTEATSTPVSMTRASPTVSQSPSSSLNQHKLHSGKISGTIASVLVGVLLLIGIIFWYLRRWRSSAEIEPAPFSDSAVRIAGAFGLPDPNHSMAIGRYYDPSDPATFPKMSETQIMPNRGNVHNDEPTDSTSRPEYSGLPMV